MSLIIKCEKCNHDTELYDLVEAGRVLGRHPETIRRDVRYGNVSKSYDIERGAYFTQENLMAHKANQN